MPEHVFQHAYHASVCGLIGDTERAAAELTEVHRLRVDDPLLKPRPIGAVLGWAVIVSQPERRRMI